MRADRSNASIAPMSPAESLWFRGRDGEIATRKPALTAGRHDAASVRANTRTPDFVPVAVTGLSYRHRSAMNRRSRISVVVDQAGSALTFRASCNFNHSLSIQFRFPHSQVNMRIVRPVRGTRMLVMNLGRLPQSEQDSAIDACDGWFSMVSPVHEREHCRVSQPPEAQRTGPVITTERPRGHWVANH
jgi:hypothetical protein